MTNGAAYLLPASVGEDTAVFQNEKSLCDLPLISVLRQRPLGRLQLHLAVDASKVPALLQNRLQGKTSTVS